VGDYLLRRPFRESDFFFISLSLSRPPYRSPFSDVIRGPLVMQRAEAWLIFFSGNRRVPVFLSYFEKDLPKLVEELLISIEVPVAEKYAGDFLSAPVRDGLDVLLATREVPYFFGVPFFSQTPPLASPRFGVGVLFFLFMWFFADVISISD